MPGRCTASPPSVAGAAMIALALRVRGEQRGYAASKQMFGFSIFYLFLLFAMLLVDRMAGGRCSLSVISPA